MTDQPSRPEKKIEGEKKSNKAIIIINIIAVLVIGGMAAYYFFIFDNKNDINPRGDFAGRNISSGDFCEQWEEKQEVIKDKGLPMPDGTFEYNDKMNEFCEDGEVSEEEAKELEEMKSSFGGKMRSF